MMDHFHQVILGNKVDWVGTFLRIDYFIESIHVSMKINITVTKNVNMFQYKFFSEPGQICMGS